MEREAGYQNALNQSYMTGNNASRETFAATSLWLARTQWSSVYRGSRRDVLRAMTRPPNRHCLNTDYILGQGALDETLNFVSTQEDEQKISCIMGAFDSVIDRCENTVRSTSHNILCWLLSSRLQSRRESPFALVADKNSEVRYRRTQKQFLAFVFRLYRMASGARKDVIEAKVRPEIYAELDRIWNHNIWCLFEISKGTWPAIERQEDNPTGPSPTTSGTDDDNDDDSEDDDSEDDYDDSGYWSNIDGPSATPYREMSAGVLRGSTKVVFDEFLEILFQLCVTLCTETFVDGQPSSTLLVYFSGVLGFSADCHKFQLARQYCPKLSAIIYMQRILLLELALPMREYTTIGIPQRPRAAQFESLNRIRAKYMLAGRLYTACGQTPRIQGLLSLEYENGLSTSGGIYVWGGYVTYVIRHHKAKRLTNREFYVARFLPVRLGHVLFKYLRQPQTRLLFHCSGRPWPTSRLTNVLTKATLEVRRL
ncbi:hypothetical protein IWW34DRAFT_824845 [Fusarium oxysporum f. sp. albedinis]|nr:hypothetical protein IWW34DRAFT_824845 [Fusarium oxysporum f. sp. albedinis]